VVPFDNLAKADDVDWLRNAAVNLLYLDMSRWRDIRVVDDERVADLLRETPEASSAQAMSLNAGLAVAKRAGAGRLVMGDLLKLGSRTAITAKVFNVRTGQRIRSVREETSVQDSVMPLFGKLAQRILNVAPPQGANVGALGTTRVDAYQEYLAGVQALNRFDLQEARARLEQAIALDSAFALAHYKLALTLGWASPGEPAQRRHADAAARLLTGLPARERALISCTRPPVTGPTPARCMRACCERTRWTWKRSTAWASASITTSPSRPWTVTRHACAFARTGSSPSGRSSACCNWTRNTTWRTSTSSMH
jgi:TolB-like protein